MGAYMIRRFLLMILTLFGMSVLIFVMLRVVPGNIVDILFDSAGMVNPEDKKRLEAELGLDRPIVTQYVSWITSMMKGDLGYSYVSEKPALDEILPRIPITAKLAGLALFFSVLFGVPLGVISAVRQNTSLDYVLRIISLSGLSLP
jgi:peptide/nickel transport system permease protein